MEARQVPDARQDYEVTLGKAIEGRSYNRKHDKDDGLIIVMIAYMLILSGVLLLNSFEVGLSFRETWPFKPLILAAIWYFYKSKLSAASGTNSAFIKIFRFTIGSLIILIGLAFFV